MQDIAAILEAYGKETGLGLGEDSSLDAFVEEHAEALEADLLRHYAVDLLDWHRGP